jgi:uncharacterized protein (DUF2237 family)
MDGPRGNGDRDTVGATDDVERNVHGEPLTPCNRDPVTGFERDGHCTTSPRDPGRHEVCAVMTAEFLDYTKDQGNDLTTERPDLQFPGLDPGDRWCVCLPRWIEAADAGCAPPVALEATNEAVLDEVDLDTLEEHAAEPAGPPGD